MVLFCREACVFDHECKVCKNNNNPHGDGVRICRKCGFCRMCVLREFSRDKNFLNSGGKGNKRTAFCKSCNNCEDIFMGCELNNYKLDDHIDYFRRKITPEKLLEIFENKKIYPMPILANGVNVYYYCMGQAVCNEEIVEGLVIIGLDKDEFPKEIITRIEKRRDTKSARF